MPCVSLFRILQISGLDPWPNPNNRNSSIWVSDNQILLYCAVSTSTRRQLNGALSVVDDVTGPGDTCFTTQNRFKQDIFHPSNIVFTSDWPKLSPQSRLVHKVQSYKYISVSAHKITPLMINFVNQTIWTLHVQIPKYLSQHRQKVIIRLWVPG